MERLDKYIASRSRFSRKDVKSLLRQGKVKINHTVVSDAAYGVSEDDLLEINGMVFSAPKHIYLMLNKPKGIVSASEDRREKTVVDLVPQEWKRDGLFPAGRLDKDTTGFVLITDDGAFAHRILSPKHHVDKVYLVTLRDIANTSYTQAFAQGLPLSDGTQCLAARILFTDDPHVVRVILHEGRYHQVKRMFASLGNAVEELHREAIGGVRLDEMLPAGDCRLLTEDELKSIENDAQI